MRSPRPQPGTAGSDALKVPRAAPLGASELPKEGESSGALWNKRESSAGLAPLRAESLLCLCSSHEQRGSSVPGQNTEQGTEHTQSSSIPLGNPSPFYPREPNCSPSLSISAFSNQTPPLSFSPPAGVFIICWLPFFITHILNMHCDCNIPPAMYSAFTWLGYVNSAVNPIIYTTFNIEFRKAFMKILHC